MAVGHQLAGYGSLKPGQTYDFQGRIIDAPNSGNITNNPFLASSSPSMGGKSITDAYGSSVDRADKDYDRIMTGYQDLALKNKFTPISYASSPDIQSALASLKNFSTTGGYSDSDIFNIRERDISPIRSIYASAKQNLDRQRIISGGYSPGYAAAIAKMARESSAQIGDITTKVNANLAENIASNKLAGSQAFGSLGSSEAGRTLDTSKFNESEQDNYLNRDLSILDAQRGLYGTTPALANMFGQQVLSANQQSEQSRQFDQSQAQSAALSLIGKKYATSTYGSNPYGASTYATSSY